MRYSHNATLVIVLAGIVLAVLIWVIRPGSEGSRQVVVYTSVDQEHARRLLDKFERETGIRVRASFDIEAQKTTGLYNTIRDEQSAPIADVFWSSEASRMEQLRREGLLAPYASPSGSSIPEAYRAPDGTWYGFGARARVLVYDPRRFQESDPPGSIFDLTDPALKGRVGIANPLFGTTSSHVAALFATRGDRAKEFLLDLKKNDVRILDGNSRVRDLVGRGELWVGLTDTDDVWVGKDNGLHLEMVFPDGEPGGLGTLVMPNTIGLIRGARHPEEGKAFIDFILSKETEADLASGPSRQIPVRGDVDTPTNIVPLEDIRTMAVSIPQIVDVLPESLQFVRDHFLQ
ncbi:MAG: extracellular solute-binding protein [Planctomycetota bacterium]|nr:extracellular solute-binding protein [Planctomycetota bacterium]